MTENDHITDILAEMGKHFDALAITSDPEDGVWVVARGEDRFVSIALDHDEQALHLSISLGPVSDAAKARVLEHMLKFNFLWRQTGGMYLSMDANSDAHLMLREPLGGVDAIRINALLGGLEAKASAWKTALAEADRDDSFPENSPSAPFGGIRV